MNIAKFFGVLLGITAFAPLGGAVAEESPEAAIRASLKDFTPDSVRPAPVDGLYEVMIGPHVVYMSADGRYMLQGDVIDVATRENLTEAVRNQAQKKAIAGIGEDNMVIYGDKDSAHTVTVFTDIDCGYCRKLHQEMDQFNAKGIRVRYLLFPRAGVKSESYTKAVSVWCADDRNAELTKAKAGATPQAKTCDNPVQDHMAMGRTLGVRGTPTIIMEDGSMLPGYVPAARLAVLLEQESK